MQNQKLLEGNIEKNVVWSWPSIQHLPFWVQQNAKLSHTVGETFVKVFGRGWACKMFKNSLKLTIKQLTLKKKKTLAKDPSK